MDGVAGPLSIACGSFVASLNARIDHPRAPVATDMAASPEEFRRNVGEYERVVIARPTRLREGIDAAGNPRYSELSGFGIDDIGKGDEVLVILICWPVNGGAIEPDVEEWQVARAQLDQFLDGVDSATDEPDEPDGEPTA